METSLILLLVLVGFVLIFLAVNDRRAKREFEIARCELAETLARQAKPPNSDARSRIPPSRYSTWRAMAG